MLIDKELFDTVEEQLIQNGKLKDFESEYGKIKGRIMITRTSIPDGLNVKTIPNKTSQAFEASFDFYDSTIGLALYTDTKEAATEIWITPQTDNVDPPAQEWIGFFVQKLIESIDEDGSYGTPIYSFVNDTCDLTIVPTEAPIE